MTDHDFQDLFARLDEAPHPRPEFVERVLRDFDAIADPSGAVPEPIDTTVHEPTDPHGPRREPGYLVEPEDKRVVALARPHAHRRRAIAVLAAVAAVIGVTVAVAVTRPGTHHQSPVAPPAPSGPQPQLYWRDANGIGRANLDGTDMVSSLQLIPQPGFMFRSPCNLAANGAHIYWSATTDAVHRANLDGTGINQDFIAGAGDDRCDVVVDGAHIYWDSGVVGNLTIGRANLDGTNVQKSIASGLGEPCGLAVDGAHIYWFNGGTGTIGRANLDGTAANPNFIVTGLQSSPAPTNVAHLACGLAVDDAHIYYGTGFAPPSSRSSTGPPPPPPVGVGTIGRADLDGTNVNNTFITGPSLSGQWPVPCATDSTYIYWTLLGVSQPWIGRARLDGTDIQADFINVHPFSTPFSSPAGCAIAPTTTAPPTTTEAPTTATAAPSPATTLTITGNPALTDQMVVHVIGEGLVPDVTYTASECKVEPPYAVWRGNCFIATSHSVTADATGTVSTDLKVQKVFPGPGGGLGDPPGQVDCGVLPGCMVSLSREEANGVISFVGAFLGHLGGAVGTWDPSTGGGGGQGRVP